MHFPIMDDKGAKSLKYGNYVNLVKAPITNKFIVPAVEPYPIEKISYNIKFQQFNGLN